MLREIEKAAWCASPAELGDQALGPNVRFGFHVGSLDDALFLDQVHGRDIVEVQAGSRPSKADGLTTVSREKVAVQTADCVPVLLADAQAGRVMALHAGWRGMVAGILGKGVALFRGAAVRAVCGPCIGPSAFEVGPEVVAAFAEPSLGLHAEQQALILTKGVGDRWHIDLGLASLLLLGNAGVSPDRVSILRSCTFNNPEWPSYRREGKGCSRIWTWIQRG